MYKGMLTLLVFGSVSDMLPYDLSVVVLTALRDGVEKFPLYSARGELDELYAKKCTISTGATVELLFHVLSEPSIEA